MRDLVKRRQYDKASYESSVSAFIVESLWGKKHLDGFSGLHHQAQGFAECGEG